MPASFAPLRNISSPRGLGNDLLALIGRMNRATDGTMVVPSEYLEIVIVKR